MSALTSLNGVRWIRENLFSSFGNTALTLFGLAVVWLVLVPAIDWALVRAVWSGDSREVCLDPAAGACWPYIEARLGQIVYGFYDKAARWRVDIVFVLGAIGIAWLMLPRLPSKWLVAALLLTVYPIIVFVLLSGGIFGLDVVPTSRWGGLLLTLLVAATGIVTSLPIGIALALARQSDLPVIKWMAIAFIEIVRGVPLITLLFMASNLLPLFLPDGMTADKLVRALVAFSLFSSAYMAEVVRGGLQAIPRGQTEAAHALGLGYWTVTGLIVLPQALRLVIPGIVNTFIGLFKDTTLISIIGFFDLLGVIQSGNADPDWATPNTAFTGYIFVGAVFWAFCFGLSRYAGAVETRLAHADRGQK
ncbi:MAG: ABC transporter permease subunit [Alphaproteobacteria bacterium]|nr:ABC transporter permease subunit [Alphaproteobacteria bacterium]